ncbi:MAG: DNA recombination protein RmuC, partial [Candidatus Omnitrophota bacterium]
MSSLFISITAVAGFFTGAAVVFLWAQQRTHRIMTERDVLKSQLENANNLLVSERVTKDKLQSEFHAAAAEALNRTAAQFIESAIKDLRQVKTETELGVQKKNEELGLSLTEVRTKLDDYQKIVKQFEQERFQMYGNLEKSLAEVLKAEQMVRLEAGALKRVLTSSSGVRGKWGEKILQEILEQNNMVRGIHYQTQVSVGSDEAGADLRPDFVISLPGGKRLIVDSKEVVSEYVMAQDTEDPDIQKVHLDKLVQNIRNQLVRLSRKEYQTLLDRDIPFVVMFIPSEAAIRAAFATDPSIFEEATGRRVILASPMTIMPLIYLISHGWQQHQLAQNAKEIGAVVEVLGERLFKFVEHLQGIRSGITKSSESWDKAMASWQSRVAPQLERIKVLGGRIKEAEAL